MLQYWRTYGQVYCENFSVSWWPIPLSVYAGLKFPHIGLVMIAIKLEFEGIDVTEWFAPRLWHYQRPCE